MAPPRRSSKKRETRMDAAIDAMSPMGFPKSLVRTTVNNLLKVYGGPEGWVFIEGDAYKILIETLLGDQNQANASGLDNLIENNQGDDHNENEASTSGCSNIALVPCSNIEPPADKLPTNQAADTSSASSQTGNQPCIMSVNSVTASSETGDQLAIIKHVDTLAAAINEPSNHLPIIKAVATVLSAENETHCRTANSPHIKAPQPVGRCKIVNSPPQTKAPNPKKRCETANSPLPLTVPQPVEGCKTINAPPPQTKALQPVESLQRCRPCYGWISDDDGDEEEEEVKLVELPPAPLSQVLSMFVNVNDGGN